MQAIQKFMQGHEVNDLQAHLPRLKNIAVSPNPVDLGQLLRVELDDPAEASWRVVIDSNSNELELRSQEGRSSTFLARSAGTATIDISVIDATTLLSAQEQRTVEIAAAVR